MLKCQFHIHTAGDPVHHIKYSPKELINRAKKLGYHVLSITCHRKILFTKSLEAYARKKGILLIPGIEFEIDKKHLLCINAHEDIYKVRTFEDLKTYRAAHPESFIIAPHPFFPGPSLRNKLEENIALFDAIEISWAYTKTKDYNKKAVIVGDKYKIPLLATADCHIIDNLNLAYCTIDAQKNPEAIFKAIKEKNFRNECNPTTVFKILYSLGTVSMANLLRKFKNAKL